MFPIIATYRDFRDFIAAKKIKREPLRFTARAGACASYKPPDRRGFDEFRASLRGVGDWGRASERLDALEHALRKRCDVGLPMPRRVLQNEDASLTLFWEGATVRCFTDGFVSTIGGLDGVGARTVTSELIDLLAFQVKIQSAS